LDLCLLSAGEAIAVPGDLPLQYLKFTAVTAVTAFYCWVTVVLKSGKITRGLAALWRRHRDCFGEVRVPGDFDLWTWAMQLRPCSSGGCGPGGLVLWTYFVQQLGPVWSRGTFVLDLVILTLPGSVVPGDFGLSSFQCNSRKPGQ
jgi:hypothetical protein